MLRAKLLGTAVFLTLTGCGHIGDSRINPVNWFGSSISAQLDTNGQPPNLIPNNRRPLVIDNRTMVQSIISLNIDRTPTGAIVAAVGITQTQGYFNAELVSNNITNGVLNLEFRAQSPKVLEVPGTMQSRTINAAFFINQADLQTISSVRVTTVSNALTSAR
jgi:hypothetical protein